MRGDNSRGKRDKGAYLNEAKRQEGCSPMDEARVVVFRELAWDGLHCESGGQSAALQIGGCDAL